jgi:hypothetical protein
MTWHRLKVSAKRRRERNLVLRKGPLKGKRVEFASTTGIETFANVAEEVSCT